MESVSFQDVEAQFVAYLTSLREILPIVGEVIEVVKKTAKNQLDEFILQHNIQSVKEGDEITYTVKGEDIAEFRRLGSQYHSTVLGVLVVPSSFIVTLVSQFDLFLGSLLRAVFLTQPGLLTSSDKNITFAQLSEFKSIEEAKEFFVEKEIESVLRLSHPDQFRWLSKKLEMELNKDLPNWPSFVEITERRNLFVHTGGVVSRQYIANCCDHGVIIGKEVEVGKQLYASRKYFEKSLECVLEIGVKLVHVVWRKLLPNDRIQADRSLNAICYDLIVEEQYDLAIELLRFGTEIIKKHSSEDALISMRLNKAQAHKWNDDESMCKQIVDSIDWSTKDSYLKMIRAVLLDQFEEATRLMKMIGDSHENVGRLQYRDWPIFKEYRKTSMFLEAYQDVFGEEFKYIEKENIRTAIVNRK